MKLVSYRLKNSEMPYRVGYAEHERIVDVQHTYQSYLISKGEKDLVHTVDAVLPSNPDQFFAFGSFAMERAKRGYEYGLESNIVGFHRDEVQLSTPIPHPSKIICVGKNYADHAAEMNSAVPDYPVLFAKFSNALIGPHDTIQKSATTSKLDYEAELAIVIGKEASNVKRENGYDYIAGYTIGNDISARDLQNRTQQWLQGKTLDRSTPVGPWIVTKDEVPDPGNLAIRSSVNGQLRQSSSTSRLIFDIPFLIEYITRNITLNPGDLILTGTPDGVGFAMDPPQFLEDGDIVALEIEGIGRLENKVKGTRL